MKITRVDCVCAAVIAAAIGCIARPVQADEVQSAIEAADAQFSAAAARGDSAGLAALYAADAQVLPAGSEPIRGRDAIGKFWQGALDSGIAEIGLKTVEVFGRGSTAAEVGQYALRDKSGKEIDHGKYIVIWRHEGGKWRLLRDMFSTNVPPAKK